MSVGSYFMSAFTGLYTSIHRQQTSFHRQQATMKLVLLLLMWRAWLDNAADVAGAEVSENSEMLKQAEVVESEDVLELKENSSDAWIYGNPVRAGPQRRRFVVGYYPNLGTAITRHSWLRGGRRRHWAIKPEPLLKGGGAQRQDLYWSGNSRWASDVDNTCMDAGDHEDDLYWHSCHNGGNQQFWFEQWGGDASRAAWHIHIGGNKGRRRRHSCVDFGGGRLYIHGCHNGDNQRFRHWAATTTTSTSTTTTTTTKVVPVHIKTFMLPEKIEWKIMRHNKNGQIKICDGGKYSTWYNEFQTGCSLPPGTYTLHCMDQKGYGWAGAYMKIKGQELCKDFLWEGKEKKVTFVV